MELDEIYIDLKVRSTIKLCMHQDLIELGIVVVDDEGNYVIANDKQRELVDYVRENDSQPTVELVIGD